MSEHTFGKSYSKFVNVLIFIFPIVINSVKVAGDIVLFILAVMGIFIAISQKLSPFIVKDIKVYSYLTTGYFLAVCLSVLFSGKAMELVHYIPRDFHFLFAPFIALALYKAEINVNYLLAGVKVGLIALGLIILYESLLGISRPSGVMNAAVLANLTVSMFIFVVILYQQESLKYKIFTFLSLFLGLFVILASGTRGAWVSLLLLLLLWIYLYFIYKQKNKSSKKSKIFVAFIIALVLSVGSLNQYVNDRVHMAYAETSNWFFGDKTITQVGVRLEIYKTAFYNIEDIPFFGHGYRTSNQALFNNVSSNIGKRAFTKNHLHNAYLTNLYNGGIVLLGALLLLLFVPLIIFIKAMSQNRDKLVFIAGISLTVGFASHGMFNILLGDVFMNAFYVFFLAIFLHLTAKLSKVS